MSVEWIEYRGKPILYTDCRGMNPERLVQNLENIFDAIRESVNDLVLLINHENVNFTTEFLAKAKELTKESRKGSETTGRFKVRKIAMVGLKGLGSFLLFAYTQSTGQEIVDFKTEEEAKEWLIK